MLNAYVDTTCKHQNAFNKSKNNKHWLPFNKVSSKQTHWLDVMSNCEITDAVE